MTLETLQQKLAAAKQAQDQAIANANAAGGAIQILEQLIAEETATVELPQPAA